MIRDIFGGARLGVLAWSLLVLTAWAVAARDADDLGARIDAAARSWDLEAAESLLEEARQLEVGGEDMDTASVVARAALLVAELRRARFEELPEEAREARRELGEAIDRAAESGLDALEQLELRRSEHYRLEADLLATMIRSDFRARRFLEPMEAAIEKALELDPDNARAWVSAAKPPLFAEGRRRDLDEALRLLDRALELDPDLESARLLRARAWELLGDRQRARADLEALLEANPESAPARERLEAMR